MSKLKKKRQFMRNINGKKVKLPKRDDGRKHLSECLLFIDPSLYCTCDDWSPT